MAGKSKADARKVVLAALARGESISAAAKAAGVSRAAIYQWANRGDEEVKAALARVGQVSPPPAKLLPDRGALAQALGVSLPTVRNWIASGLSRGPDGFEESEVRRWLATRGLEPGRSGRPKKLHVLAGREAAAREASGEPAAADSARPPGDDEGPPEAGDTAAELLRKEALGKAQREWWRAKIDRLKALQQEGLLVDREEVTAEHAQMVSRARSRLLALPGALSAVLAAEVDARRVEALLDTQLRLALEELGAEVPA